MLAFGGLLLYAAPFLILGAIWSENWVAGFVTSALEHGADIFRVMDVARPRRVETLEGYDRRAKAFRNHAGDCFL